MCAGFVGPGRPDRLAGQRDNLSTCPPRPLAGQPTRWLGDGPLRSGREAYAGLEILVKPFGGCCRGYDSDARMVPASLEPRYRDGRHGVNVTGSGRLRSRASGGRMQQRRASADDVPSEPADVDSAADLAGTVRDGDAPSDA